MANVNLKNAKTSKNDEFYTQYSDIQSEVNAYLDFDKDVFKDKVILLPCDDPEWSNFTKFFAQNFQRFGLKKLISTSYAYNSKNVDFDYQPTLFETVDPRFEIKKSKEKGKIFTLTADENADGKINIEDLKWNYLEGNGDFRSEEVKKLRDEADIIITNPPFSLFREFFKWLIESNKKFLVIGNMNAVSYNEIFPYLKNNNVWLGNNCEKNGGAMYYEIPEAIANIEQVREVREQDGKKIYITRVQGVRWFTNIEHGKRHEKLSLMTEADNIKYSKHKEIKGKGYLHYNNFDAIDVPFLDAIPSDYKGIMGVPRSFFDKYNPDQFEIIGTDTKEQSEKIGIAPIGEEWLKKYKEAGGTGHITANMRNLSYIDFDGIPKTPYARILIKHKDN
jgi:hypothetical protein